jgi:2,3-dihydroxy-p-cumate/2,3-dihydroxybenzoate 3,4-dioxygenase
MIRYSKLSYVALNVSDIERSKAFYTEILGLQLSEIGAQGEVYLRCSADHHNVVLTQGEPVGIRRIGWEMESPRDVDLLIETLRANGIKVFEVSAEERRQLHQSPTYRFVDPVLGLTVEFFASQHQYAKTYERTVVNILRLGHVVVKSPDVENAVKQYTETFNFRVSDQVEEMVAFMRCFPNPFHHSFGIGTTSGKTAALHHVNFMVNDIDDIGMAVNRFRKNNVPIVWGPGRHPPSESIFLYFLDPDGLTLEYSFGMEEFPEVDPRKHRSLYPGPSSADYWGSMPQPGFTATGAVVANADIPETELA